MWPDLEVRMSSRQWGATEGIGLVEGHSCPRVLYGEVAIGLRVEAGRTLQRPGQLSREERQQHGPDVARSGRCSKHIGDRG